MHYKGMFPLECCVWTLRLNPDYRIIRKDRIQRKKLNKVITSVPYWYIIFSIKRGGKVCPNWKNIIHCLIQAFVWGIRQYQFRVKAYCVLLKAVFQKEICWLTVIRDRNNPTYLQPRFDFDKTARNEIPPIIANENTSCRFIKFGSMPFRLEACRLQANSSTRKYGKTHTHKHKHKHEHTTHTHAHTQMHTCTHTDAHTRTWTHHTHTK
jgi:hypothetical protein